MTITPLIIRADADTRIGAGHLMRCLALAQAWKDRGGTVTFLSHCESDSLHHRITDEGFAFVPIEGSHPDPGDLVHTLEILEHLKGQDSKRRLRVVLDGYHFTPDYQRAIVDSGCRLLAIDDEGLVDHWYADIILNQNLHAHSSLYRSAEPHTHLLVGTQFVLLRQEFLKWTDWEREIPNTDGKILVTMGGSDPDNVTLKVIRGLNSLDAPGLEVKIVVGPANSNIGTLEKELHRSPFTSHLLPSVDDMPGLMAWADLAVSAGGSTCWELAFMELPSITVVLADNQKLIAESLDRAGVAVNLGWHTDLSVKRLAHELEKLISSPTKRRKMSNRGRSLIDGRGAYRVSDMLSQSNRHEEGISENIIHGQ